MPTWFCRRNPLPVCTSALSHPRNTHAFYTLHHIIPVKTALHLHPSHTTPRTCPCLLYSPPPHTLKPPMPSTPSTTTQKHHTTTPPKHAHRPPPSHPTHLNTSNHKDLNDLLRFCNILTVAETQTGQGFSNSS